MAEKGILFKAEMVRALLNTKPGTWPAEPIDPSKPFKSQTRRIVKPQPPDWIKEMGYTAFTPKGHISGRGYWKGVPGDGEGPAEKFFKQPYRVGDILWVREGLIRPDGDPWCYRADNEPVLVDQVDETAMLTWAHHKQQDYCPSMFMPRWASRIQLEVMDVRAQRLQNITEEDAKAEGCQPWQYDPMQPMTTGEMGAASPYRGGYACLWDEINDERATWKSNPWVWAYSFRRLT